MTIETAALKALKLAEGRLALLLKAYPEQSENCDHPTATRYILDVVRATLSEPAQDVGAVLVKWKRFDYSITNERMIETVNGSFTLHSEVMRTITKLEAERDAARDALEHDRSAMITAVNQFNDAFARRSWLLTSRGSYEWDDDRYREEFRGAYDELALPIEKLRQMGKDWSNCPTDHDAIMQARIDWKSRAEIAEAASATRQKREAGLREALQAARKVIALNIGDYAGILGIIEAALTSEGA